MKVDDDKKRPTRYTRDSKYDREVSDAFEEAKEAFRMASEALALRTKTVDEPSGADHLMKRVVNELLKDQVFRNRMAHPARVTSFFGLIVGALARRLAATTAGLLPRASRRSRIVRPPGMWLDTVAEFFSSRQTYENVFKEIITDLRHEHCLALQAGRVWKARWTRVLYTSAFFRAVWSHWAVKVIEGIVRSFTAK